MATSNAELVGRLLVDPRFSVAVQRDLDVVAIAMDLTEEQRTLLEYIRANPKTELNELARRLAGTGNGVFAGG